MSSELMMRGSRDCRTRAGGYHIRERPRTVQRLRHMLYKRAATGVAAGAQAVEKS